MAHSQSAGVSRVGPNGAMVIANFIDVMKAPDMIHELLDEGIVGMLDYRTGYSFDPKDVDSSNRMGRGVLRRAGEFSRVGGFVGTHTEDERLVIGRASPGNIRFEEFEGGDADGLVLKCFQLDAWADVDQDEFAGIHEMLKADGQSRSVFNPIHDEALAERLVAAVTDVHRRGGLKRRR